jgi:hypothetical protein
LTNFYHHVYRLYKPCICCRKSLWTKFVHSVYTVKPL